MVINEGLLLSGMCTLRAYPKGHLFHVKPVDIVTVHNLIVTLGKGLVGDCVLPAGLIGLTYHAFGTSTAAVNIADTHITTEVRRKIWAASSRTGAVVDFQTYYLASECTYFIKECGVYGGPTATDTLNSGTLFSHFLLSYDNSAGLNDLTFEYQLTIA